MVAKPKTKAKKSRLGRLPVGEAIGRHARILDAATAVFLERGFSGATVTEIARRAGCSLETLYGEYPTKARMFTALTSRKSKGLYEAIGPFNPERDIREALLRFAIEVLDLMMRPEVNNLHRLIVAESRTFPELGSDFWRDGTGSGLESLRAFFEVKRASGEVTVANSVRAAEVFLGLVLGMVSMKAAVGLKTAAESKEDQVAWAEYAVGLFMQLLEAKAL